MQLTVNKEDVLKLHKTATPAVKRRLEKLYGKEHFIKPSPPKKVKKAKTILDKINSIEDVFKYNKQDYKAFLKKCKDLPEKVLNYWLLQIGIACLNESWVCNFEDTNQPKWYNVFDCSGSGFVFSDSYDGYGNVYSTVGAGLRLENMTKAEHAAKIFFPQYKGYMKPKAK